MLKQLGKWEKRKRFREKLKNRVVFATLVCILCINSFFFNLITGKAAEENWKIPDTNMLLLFDISGSMNGLIQNQESGEMEEQELTRGKMATEWAEEICAILAGSDILFSTGFFSEYCCFLGSEKKIQAGDNSALQPFDHIKFNGTKTNQYNALLAAEERLKEKEGRKYIILLSDGDPDPVSWDSDAKPKVCYAEIPEGNYDDLDLKTYVNFGHSSTQVENENKPKEETSNDGKEEYTNNFQNKCLELANNESEDYMIILIGLESDVKLYGDLDKKSDKIKCYNNWSDLKELKKLLLEDIGINIGMLDAEENSFIIDKNYGRCIIRMKYTGMEEGSILTEDYKLYYTPQGKDNGEEYPIDNKISLANTTYLYLDSPKLGKYNVDFSKGTMEVQYIEERRIKKVELSLRDKNGEKCKGEEKGGCIFYDLEEAIKNGEYNFDQGKIRILVETGNDERPIGTKVVCYWKEVENLDQGYDWNLGDETDRREKDISRQINYISEEGKQEEEKVVVWSYDIEVEEGKTYICKVAIDTKYQKNCTSNTICFTAPKVPTPIPTPIIFYGEKGGCFSSAQEYIKVEPMIDIERLTIVWDEKVLFENGSVKENVDEIQVNKEAALCFQKEGVYTIEIREDGILREIAEFRITESSIINKFLKECKIRICIAIIAFAIIIWSIIKGKKKKSK